MIVHRHLNGRATARGSPAVTMVIVFKMQDASSRDDFDAFFPGRLTFYESLANTRYDQTLLSTNWLHSRVVIVPWSADFILDNVRLIPAPSAVHRQTQGMPHCCPSLSVSCAMVTPRRDF